LKDVSAVVLAAGESKRGEKAGDPKLRIFLSHNLILFLLLGKLRGASIPIHSG